MFYWAKFFHGLKHSSYDRIALRDQAVEAFKENAPQYSVWPHTDETKLATDRRVYVSTYPTMLNISWRAKFIKILNDSITAGNPKGLPNGEPYRVI